MTTQPQPEALRLAGALLEPVVLDKHAMQAAAELRRLHAECEALRNALERISGFTMSQFASINDMALECVNVANDALAARAAKEQSNG